MGFFSHLLDSLSEDNSRQSAKDILAKEIFNASPEAVLYVDKKGIILEANRRIEDWLGYQARTLVGCYVADLPFIDKKKRGEIAAYYKKRIKGETILPYEMQFNTTKKDVFLGRVHGSVVRDSDNNIVGSILMISNITETKKVFQEEKDLIRDLQILSDTASGLVELPKNEDIYKFIGEKLHQLLGNNQITMLRYDSETGKNKALYYFGATEREEMIIKRLGLWPVGKEYLLKDYAVKDLLERKLSEVKGGAYELFQGKLSRPMAKMLESMAQIDKVYAMGFAWGGELFGSANAIIRKGSKIREESVNAFLQQASVALQKRRADEALQKAHDELEIKVEERTADLKKSNEELQKFMLAVKEASDTIIITDNRGRIAYANQAALQNTGYDFEEMQGKTPALWVLSEKDKYSDEIWEDIEKNKAVILAEYKNRNKDGREYISEVHLSPILDDKAKVIYLVWIERDVTKAKEVDQAKTEFVSLASHQLRTPLSAINWYTEMLLDGDAGEITKDQENYLREIYSGSQRMVDLVNSLLNVSRLELGTFIIEPEKASIMAISDDVLKELEPQINNKKQIITKDYDDKIPEIQIDPKLTRIIFQNLLSNAVKYTPNHGKIGISIQIDKRDSKQLLISVSDTGYGIPKYQQDRIFSKLFRADNVKKMEAEGTGLGVYIIKQILDNSGGKIWFESEENKGSTFHISIPMSGMIKREGSKALT